MSSWAARTKLHLLQKAHKRSDESDESPLLSLLAPQFGALCEKRETSNDCDVQSEPKRPFRQRGPWLTGTEQSAGRNYDAHHFNCHSCIAAGLGKQYGNRCAIGQALWTAYAGSEVIDCLRT